MLSMEEVLTLDVAVEGQSNPGRAYSPPIFNKARVGDLDEEDGAVNEEASKDNAQDDVVITKITKKRRLSVMATPRRVTRSNSKLNATSSGEPSTKRSMKGIKTKSKVWVSLPKSVQTRKYM